MAEPKDITVMCVDDDSEYLDFETSLIASWGYNVIKATGIQESIQLIEENKNKIGIVLSDFRMADGTGFDLREKMLPDLREIPFLIVSACIDREMALEGLERKISRFIDKPFSNDEMRQAIEKESEERVQYLEEAAELRLSFLSEAAEILEELDPVLVSIEEGKGSPDAFDLVFRLVHTLKGSSGVLERSEFTAFLHCYEDLIGKLRNGVIKDHDASVSLMILAFDKASACIESIQGGDEGDLELDEITLQLKNGLAENDSGEREKSTSTPSSSKISSKKSADKTNSDSKDSVLVPTKMLDEFMVHSGEITVIRNMIKKLVGAIEKKLPSDKDVGLLTDLLDNMHKINTSMQAQIVDQRKQPVFSFVKRYPRTIRELSRQLDKPASFNVSGSDLRVDPKVATTLSKCLIHLVRNSMDHGLESKELRKKSGKSPEGKINLSFEEDGENTIITISDDGGGIDVEKIKDKLIEKGMFDESQLKKMKKATILSQIFEAGFSTAVKVTDVSGRGVGMDMVKSSIEELGGRIELDSEVGNGTIVRLVVPVPKSVTIINALLVKAGTQTYSIPQDSIFRLLRFTEYESDRYLKKLEGADVLNFGGTLLPIIDLTNFLELGDEKKAGLDSNSAHYNDTNMVILSSNNCLVALKVDSILDAEDIVVKELIPALVGVGPYKGATFLGDGSVGLILDCDNLVESSGFGVTGELEEPDLEFGTSGSSDDGEELLVFKIGKLKQPWAVRLCDVYRFEEIEFKNIKKSGNEPVINYRNMIAPVLDLEEILDISVNESMLSDQTTKTDKDRCLTLVVESGNRFYMCRISEVIEVTRQSSAIIDEIRDSEFIEGTTILYNKSVAPVINLSKIIATSPFFVPEIIEEPPLDMAAGFGFF